MAAVAAHEVLRNNQLAVLVLFHFEHWHVVQDSVNEARSANEVANPSNRDPQHWVDEVHLDGNKDANEDHEHAKQHQVLIEDDQERLLNRHTVDKPLVDMVKQLLGSVGFILFDLPKVCGAIEITFIAFNFHLTHGQEWNCLEAVLLKDSFSFCVVCVVNDAEEDGDVELGLVMEVRVRRASQLIVDFLALLAALLDCEQVDHIVRSWVLDDQLSMMNKKVKPCLIL